MVQIHKVNIYSIQIVYMSKMLNVQRKLYHQQTCTIPDQIIPVHGSIDADNASIFNPTLWPLNFPFGQDDTL